MRPLWVFLAGRGRMLTHHMTSLCLYGQKEPKKPDSGPTAYFSYTDSTKKKNTATKHKNWRCSAGGLRVADESAKARSAQDKRTITNHLIDLYVYTHICIYITDIHIYTHLMLAPLNHRLQSIHTPWYDGGIRKWLTITKKVRNYFYKLGPETTRQRKNHKSLNRSTHTHTHISTPPGTTAASEND